MEEDEEEEELPDANLAELQALLGPMLAAGGLNDIVALVQQLGLEEGVPIAAAAATTTTTVQTAPSLALSPQVLELDQTVYFACEDGSRIALTWRAAMHSGLVSSMVSGSEDVGVLDIPLLQVESHVATKVAEFLTHHELQPYEFIPKPLPRLSFVSMHDLCRDKWDAQFADQLQVDNLLYDVMLAANFLDIPTLLDLCVVKLAAELQNHSSSSTNVETFLQLDFKSGELTPREMRRVKEENAWLFNIQPLSPRNSTGEEERQV
ncbi:hypothetical protein BASA81_005144 [Batrachochytrium salamandrivorans]|nr:hypothetical protein BASA81_005144 [Batrachochytrium salamandrivorans]